MVVPTNAVLIASFQVPVIAGTFVELVGSKGGVEFWHKGAITLKVVVISGLTITSNVAVDAHTPFAGVKV